jgi:hypothetical protein
MPLYGRVRGLKGAWKDLVRADELSELGMLLLLRAAIQMTFMMGL